jgi:hypothetical protein
MLNSLHNFGENVLSPLSTSSIGYLHRLSLSKLVLNFFIQNHPLILISEYSVVLLMPPMFTLLINLIVVPCLPSSLAIPWVKKHTNYSIYEPKMFLLAGM